MLNTNLLKARSYAEKLFSKNDKELDKELPNFDKNYVLAQKSAKLGFAQRKDMPVIDLKDVRLLQTRLAKGAIDISPPYAKNDIPDNPFPQGLDVKKGKHWVTHGMAMFDGDAKDDVVSAKFGQESVGNLKPIQAQIYFDKSIAKMADVGAEGSKAFQTKKENIMKNFSIRGLNAGLIEFADKDDGIRIGAIRDEGLVAIQDITTVLGAPGSRHHTSKSIRT